MPEQWLWHEDHDGLALPEAFELFWARLPVDDLLIADMGALLHCLPS